MKEGGLPQPGVLRKLVLKRKQCDRHAGIIAQLRGMRFGGGAGLSPCYPVERASQPVAPHKVRRTPLYCSPAVLVSWAESPMCKYGKYHAFVDIRIVCKYDVGLLRMGRE